MKKTISNTCGRLGTMSKQAVEVLNSWWNIMPCTIRVRTCISYLYLFYNDILLIFKSGFCYGSSESNV